MWHRFLFLRIFWLVRFCYFLFWFYWLSTLLVCILFFISFIRLFFNLRQFFNPFPVVFLKYFPFLKLEKFQIFIILRKCDFDLFEFFVNDCIICGLIILIKRMPDSHNVNHFGGEEYIRITDFFEIVFLFPFLNLFEIKASSFGFVLILLIELASLDDMFHDILMKAIDEMKLSTHEDIFQESESIKFSWRWIIVDSNDIVERFIDKAVDRIVIELKFFYVELGLLVLILFDDTLD